MFMQRKCTTTKAICGYDSHSHFRWSACPLWSYRRYHPFIPGWSIPSRLRTEEARLMDMSYPPATLQTEENLIRLFIYFILWFYCDASWVWDTIEFYSLPVILLLMYFGADDPHYSIGSFILISLWLLPLVLTFNPFWVCLFHNTCPELKLELFCATVKHDINLNVYTPVLASHQVINLFMSSSFWL